MIWRTLTRFILSFFFNDTATTEIYTLSLHDALPIYARRPHRADAARLRAPAAAGADRRGPGGDRGPRAGDRKSTRLNSSHLVISYAVFCLKKKTHHDAPHAPSTACAATCVRVTYSGR